MVTHVPHVLLTVPLLNFISCRSHNPMMRQVIPLEPQRLLKPLHIFPVLNRRDITQKQTLIKLTILNRIPNPQTQCGVSHLRKGDKVKGHELDIVFKKPGDFVFVDGDELAEDVFVDGSEG